MEQTETCGTHLADPDVQLMLRVQAGDGAAFAELQARYAPRVFGHFCRLLRDRAEAEDLTQDVFLRLYRSRDRYLPRGRFGTLVYCVTLNVARNALRSRRRAGDRRTSAPDLLEEQVPDRRDGPSAPLERAELAGVVRAAVAGLAGRQREAVELYQFSDRSCAAVAAEMGMTPKAAKSLLHRARIKLREALRPFAG